MDNKQFEDTFGLTLEQAEDVLADIKSYNQEEMSQWFDKLELSKKQLTLCERIESRTRSERLKAEFKRRGIL